MTSGAYCAVQGCKNQKSMKEISFFKLPTDAKRREDWLYMIGREDLLKKRDLKPECHFVCHVHFEESMMIRKPLLRQNAIPTIGIPSLRFLDEAIRIPTTREDKSTQTRKKFCKDFTIGKRRGVVSEGERKRKRKDKLGESETKKKILAGGPASLVDSSIAARLLRTLPEIHVTSDTSTELDISTESAVTSDVLAEPPETIVIDVDVKQECFD